MRQSLGETPDAGVPHNFLSQRGVIADSCTQCHRMEPLFSHPVGIRPRMPTPQHLPLDGGVMTCGTCHDADAGHRSGSGAMLRSPTAAALCAQCHAETGSASATPHAAGLGRAHLDTSGTLGRSTLAITHGILDSESESCLSCHDGSAAGDAGVHTARRTPGADPSDHPFGVPYRDNPRQDGAIRLVRTTNLDPRVRLFDRKVGCGSCHSVYSPQPDHLVMSNLQSRLCLSCHIE